MQFVEEVLELEEAKQKTTMELINNSKDGDADDKKKKECDSKKTKKMIMDGEGEEGEDHEDDENEEGEEEEGDEDDEDSEKEKKVVVKVEGKKKK